MADRDSCSGTLGTLARETQSERLRQEGQKQHVEWWTVGCDERRASNVGRHEGCNEDTVIEARRIPENKNGGGSALGSAIRFP
jgi:hypothetical protein